jgi:CBS domain-containing protein
MGIGVSGHGVLVFSVYQMQIVGYIESHASRAGLKRNPMKVSDILRLKGNTLYTTTPLAPLAEAVKTMADHDLGSILVMDHGDLVGILTFREVILALNGNGGSLGNTTVRGAMDDHPLTCSPDTELDEVRRMMLERHARYLPVLNNRDLMGVVSFYDVAKAVVDSQNFENQMLKAYIRDWPSEEEGAKAN